MLRHRENGAPAFVCSFLGTHAAGNAKFILRHRNGANRLAKFLLMR